MKLKELVERFNLFEKNELILMRAPTARNYLNAKFFTGEVMNYYKNKPKLVVDIFLAENLFALYF